MTKKTRTTKRAGTARQVNSLRDDSRRIVLVGLRLALASLGHALDPEYSLDDHFVAAIDAAYSLAASVCEAGTVHVERGKGPSIKTFLAVADLLGLSAEWRAEARLLRGITDLEMFYDGDVPAPELVKRTLVWAGTLYVAALEFALKWYADLKTDDTV
ncbi:MAG TPA: hypothetical protein VFA39_20050 [Steroidobacteraceae bacterium]|nr:hypothetical protein [Steroidobacteraceae bacterium]